MAHEVHMNKLTQLKQEKETSGCDQLLIQEALRQEVLKLRKEHYSKQTVSTTREVGYPVNGNCIILQAACRRK
ncbi:uncharacterized protein LOC143228071 isoform X2 [Tachypleus tridentatus]|uniref:uncharacterized protein LOC143228071 isoform X2 n=1 Tax=Tachypleus tridentatus TaxID=6853 RepID=UPI003FD595B3